MDSKKKPPTIYITPVREIYVEAMEITYMFYKALEDYPECSRGDMMVIGSVIGESGTNRCLFHVKGDLSSVEDKNIVESDKLEWYYTNISSVVHGSNEGFLKDLDIEVVRVH